MSVQFFKIFSGVLFIHLAGLTVVWVGFSAPPPRLPATFTYLGALAPGDASSPSEEVWQKWKMSDQFVSDHPEASYVNHWIELRGPSK